MFVEKKLFVIFYLVCFSLFIGSGNLWASPSYPFLIKVEQPNGEVLSTYLKGDESYSYRITQDGYVIVKNKDNFYVYADQRAGGNEPVPSSIIAHDKGGRSVQEIQFLQNLPKGLTPEQAAYRKMKVKAERLKMAAARTFKDNNLKNTSGDSYVPRNGNPHFLVFLFSYADVPFSFSNDVFSRMLNEPGFSDDGATGSVAYFYSENSWGQFQPVFDVVGPIQLPGNRAEYGGPDGDAGKMFTEGAVIADQQYNIDFSQYDFDNNGEVDNLYGFFAGYDQAQGGPEECVWSHASSIAWRNIVLDGTKIGGYACSSELKWNWGTQRVGIGTFVHEFGHVLGLPDFYDTDGESNGAGHTPGGWSTMAGGAYNNDGRTPPLFGAMEREMLGWCSIPVCPEGAVTLEKIQANKDNPGYKIDSPTPNEFFVIEYREQIGFDAFLPGSGMLIWHVDKSDNGFSFVSGSDTYNFTYNTLWGWNSVNNVEGHPCYDLVESGSSSIVGGDVSMDAAHMWSSVTNIFDPHAWSGESCNSTISNIVNHGNYATFDNGGACEVEATPVARFFDDSDFIGAMVGLPEGEFSVSGLNNFCLPEDVISSIEVEPGYKVTVYTDDNFEGTSATFTANSNYVGNSLNDQISSIVIEPNGVSGLSGVYKIKGRNSNKYMDMDGNSRNNGTKVVQWDDEQGEPYQQFEFTEINNGVYSIASVPSDRVFDIINFSGANGAALQIYDNNATDNQQFILFDAGDGYYQLVARYCGKVLEVPFNSFESGQQIKLFDNNNQFCSHWELEHLTPAYWLVNKEDLTGIDSFYDLRNNDVLVWDNLTNITSTGAFEGVDAISFVVDEAAVGDSFGFGIHNNYQTHDFSKISRYGLHFAIKTDCPDLLKVRLTGLDDSETSVDLTGEFSVQANSTWQEVVVPVAEFVERGLELDRLFQNVMFSIVSEQVSTAGAVIEVDDVYFSKLSSPVNVVIDPSNANAEIGEDFTFNCVTAALDVAYQWKKEGVNIPGATQSSLQIANAGLDDAGNYTCEVWNSGGSAFSNEAVLVVDYPSFSEDVTDNGGVVSASHRGVNTREGIEALIDNNVSTKYCAMVNAGVEAWMQYESTVKVMPDSYSLSSANDFEGRDPKTVVFQG
jgi:M6 family metalloprotease-like protein